MQRIVYSILGLYHMNDLSELNQCQERALILRALKEAHCAHLDLLRLASAAAA